MPVTPFLFDLLHLDGTDLLDHPARDRWAQLDAVVDRANRVARITTGSVETAATFLADSLDRGHEGVMAKALSAPYEAGRRGGGWLKVKPVHTLDLVVACGRVGIGAGGVGGCRTSTSGLGIRRAVS